MELWKRLGMLGKMVQYKVEGDVQVGLDAELEWEGMLG